MHDVGYNQSNNNLDSFAHVAISIKYLSLGGGVKLYIFWPCHPSELNMQKLDMTLEAKFNISDQ